MSDTDRVTEGPSQELLFFFYFKKKTNLLLLKLLKFQNELKKSKTLFFLFTFTVNNFMKIKAKIL